MAGWASEDFLDQGAISPVSNIQAPTIFLNAGTYSYAIDPFLDSGAITSISDITTPIFTDAGTYSYTIDPFLDSGTFSPVVYYLPVMIVQGSTTTAVYYLS